MIRLRDIVRLILPLHRTSHKPPTVQPDHLNHARKQAARADEALRWVEAQDPIVDRASERAERIHRENHLGPAFMRVMRGSRDA